MGKRQTEIRIDNVSFNAKYWAQKTLAEFKTEANKPDAAMVPPDVRAEDRDAWLKQAFDLIKKADAGDDSYKPDVNTEELKLEAELAKNMEADKTKDKGKTTPQ